MGSSILLGCVLVILIMPVISYIFGKYNGKEKESNNAANDILKSVKEANEIDNSSDSRDTIIKRMRSKNK